MSISPQIQTYLQGFIGKIITIALVLFILFGVNIQSIRANAQTSSQAASTTKPAPTLDKQDSRIGAITKCSVDTGGITKDTLKTDSKAANTFIFDCMKDIIRIVITVSVILAVMRLMWIGIQFLNTFGDGAALNRKLSEGITGFVVGALILGLFASFIQIVNPAALRIDKIFSPKVIDDYKKNSKTTNPFGTTGSTTTGGTSGTQTTDQITKILASNPTDPKLIAEKEAVKTQLTACKTNVALSTAAEVNNCTAYRDYTGSGSTTADANFPATISGNKFANSNIEQISADKTTNTVSFIFDINGKKIAKQYKFDPVKCANSPLLTSSSIARGSALNKEPCVLTMLF